jgi:hypothetical protein
MGEPWFELVISTITKSPALRPFLAIDAERKPEEVAELVCGAVRLALPGRQIAGIEEIPQTLPDEVDTVISRNRDATNRAGWVWGTTLARISASNNGNVAKLEAGWALASNHDVAAEAFLEELSAIAASSNQKETMYQGIYMIAHKIAAHPESWVYRGDKDRFLRAIDEWKNERNLAQIWNLHLFDFPFHYDSLGVLDVLRRMDPTRYLALLDEICLPPVTEYALRQLDIVEDFETILNLLAVAPVVAVAEANEPPKWNRNFSTAMLLKTALDYVGSISDDGTNVPDQGEEQAGEWDKEATRLFGEVASVLMAREDGLFLSLYWMCHLTQADKPSLWSRKGWSPVPAALGAMAAKLHLSNIELKEIKTIFPQFIDYDEEKLKTLRLQGCGDLERFANPAGLDVFFTALWIHNAADEKNAAANDEIYLDWFESLLIRRDGGFHLNSRESEPRSHLWSLGLMYAKTPNPQEAWVKTWNLLEEQRRVFRHRWLDDKTMWADDPSFFQANIGLLLIDWLLSPEIGKKEHVDRTFSAVFDVVLGVVITPPVFKNGRWRHLLSSLFSRLPHVALPENKATLAAVDSHIIPA